MNQHTWTHGNYSKILEDDSLTFSEKILSIRNEDTGGDKTEVRYAGDYVISKVDFTYAHDVQGPLVIQIFNELKGNRVYDPNRILLNIDHDYPASSERSANLHNTMRKFAKEQNLHIQEGSNCHQYIMENFAVPGMIIVGADSHTTTLGSLGAFATGMGSSDVASIFLSGITWMRVPKTISVNLSGKFRPWVSTKDVAIKLLGMIGTDGANYCSIEYTGQGLQALSVDSRTTLTNLGVEMGAKNSVIEPDETTLKYIRGRGREPQLIVPLGKEADVKQQIEIDLGEIVPMVSLPGTPGNAKPISESSDVEVGVVMIGTCTNGRLEDLRKVAEVLKGKRVSSKTRLIVTPNSREVYNQALREGIIEVITASGGIVTSPGCGACAGFSKGLIGEGEVAVFAGPRNFPGRLGSIKSEIYLSSPETAAYSAITGKLSSARL
jgi:3-isopropylmalate/(R)-2-methylmalate dehydratase large subunit